MYVSMLCIITKISILRDVAQFSLHKIRTGNAPWRASLNEKPNLKDDGRATYRWSTSWFYILKST